MLFMLLLVVFCFMYILFVVMYICSVRVAVILFWFCYLFGYV